MKWTEWIHRNSKQSNELENKPEKFYEWFSANKRMQRIDRNKNEFTEEKRKKRNVICTKIHDIEKSRNTSQKRTAK